MARTLFKVNSPLFIILFFAFAPKDPVFSQTIQDFNYRKKIDLKGEWQFALDQNNQGLNEKWYQRDLNEKVRLPGTTDLNKKGILNKDSSTMHLSRVYHYEGAAWYRKKVVIPSEFRDKHIALFLERTKSSKVWIDDQPVGGSFLLQSPQRFDVSSYLSPGVHYVTVCVDNSLKLTPYGNVHIYADDTQTNWNGIVGELYLEVTSKTFISDLQVYPDIDKRKINIKLSLANHLHLEDLSIDLLLDKTENGDTKKLQSLNVKCPADSVLFLTYEMGDETDLWDEYKQALYKLTAVISDGKTKDAKTATFGMRKFSASGTQFKINGRTTFLRGKHDAAVFPIHGHAPMDVQEWIKVFQIAKDYGINHYRFHTWCPPEAAFTAADRVGIYLQVELPFWGGLDSDSTAQNLRNEGIGMLKSYGNHPSFVMFSHGNEIWGGLDRVEQNIIAFKNYDSRPLYTMGSNVSIGYAAPQKSTDFFVGARTPSNGDTILTHTRLTHAFADSDVGGMLNNLTPSTEVKFTYPVSQIKMPVVSHEIGQYQIYPDYGEIKKYTGVLKARNLEIFRSRLKAAGLLDQNIAFQKASGAWAALCYKAEMEAALRTPGFAGFQLLDLQDFPGQGTALVGILDAFMDSKEVVSKEDWRKSCDDVVLLCEFPKYCWTNEEVFSGKMVIANYANRSIEENVNWEIKTDRGLTIAKGKFVAGNNQGGVKELGTITFPLSDIAKAEKLNIHVSVENSRYKNNYPIWVYPSPKTVSTPQAILVSNKLDAKTIERLRQGGKVLLFPRKEDLMDRSVGGLFPPEFWNWGMFKGISESNKKPVSPGTLGLLMDPQHPVFNSFPTDFHTNWQWFSIIKESNPLNLSLTAHSYRPIIQVVDNLERNHKLGLIFEFKVGAGKLLVCMSRLDKIMQKPEANQLYRSILKYMEGSDFDPKESIAPEKMTELVGIL